MAFFATLLIDGALAGALYALIALGFVVVYKASRVVNFALGEWVSLAAVLVAVGANVLGLGLAGGLLAGAVGMVIAAWLLHTLVLSRLVGQPAISLLMITLGLGLLVRGVLQLGFRDVPRTLSLPFDMDPIAVGDVRIAADKLWVAILAVATIALIAWLQQRSRAGIALRAMADDHQAAMAVGIDVPRHVLLVWCVAGAISVVAGVLWTVVTGGGFGVGLVGLKIFPVVIIGGLDSIPGTLVAAIFIGVTESLATGYLEPHLGSGCGLLAAYLSMLVMLLVRPHGLFGEAKVARV